MNSNAAAVLLDAFDTRWETYRAELKRCRAEFSEKAVHDLRVATRRFLAVFDVLRSLSPDPRIRKLRHLFKDQLDEFDELRDVQVMLAEVSEEIDVLPALAPFEAFLQKRERRLLRIGRKQVHDLKLGALSGRTAKVRKMLLAQDKFGRDVSTALLQAVDDVYQTAKRRCGAVDPQQPSTFHRLRIAFKKFRYTLEIVHPVLPDFPLENLKLMHDYQSAMGNIQDAEVFLSTLAEFAEKHRSYDPSPVAVEYERRHETLIAVFNSEIDALNRFWRAEAERAFPWEADAPHLDGEVG